MLPQSEFDSLSPAPSHAPVAIAAITQDRALIGLLRSLVDPTTELIFVNSEPELTPHLTSRRVSVALLDSMFIEGDLGGMAVRLRETWPDLVLVVVGTAEEQSKVAAEITSGVVYRFLHRPVSAPRVRLFVEAALRRHEVENVERTLEQVRPDFSRLPAAKSERPQTRAGGGRRYGIIGAVCVALAAGAWFAVSGGRSEQPPAAAEVVSPPAPRKAAESAPAPRAQIPEEHPLASSTPVAPQTAPAPEAAAESVRDRLRQASSSSSAGEARTATAPQTPPPAPAPSFEERLRSQLAQAEAALQRGELASPPGNNAVELFKGALDMDPSNTLAKAGLVRVADRLLSAAERALTAGNPEDAKSMVDVAETLTPATSRAAFLMMQIEREHERAVLVAKRDSDAQDQQEKTQTYLRLASARLKSGQLIEPSEDNARFYLEAARQIAPDDPAVAEVSRTLQKRLLDDASSAAAAGNAAETERWLANADSAGAGRPEMASIRRSLQDTLIGARAVKVTALAQQFDGALTASSLLAPADASAKAYLLELIALDAANPVTSNARAELGAAYLRELRAALGRGDLDAAESWLTEARVIGFQSDDLTAAGADIAAARSKAAEAGNVVGANSLERIEYVSPKFPPFTLDHGITGWVELEFTVRIDGSTGDVVVTNSSPRRTFDAAAVNAVSQWRYKPVVRDGKAVEQRAAVRIRFSGE